MKLSKVLAAAVVLSLAGAAARAQIPGLPFYPTPTGMGVLASADYAVPGSGQTMLALRAGIGFGPFGATAAVGQYKATNFSREIAYGASAAMKLFGGGLLPVTISAQGGFGQLKFVSPLINYTTTYVPVGAAVRGNLPLFPLKPFVVGYYVLGSNVKKEFRVTVGADFNLLLGLGVHAAYDMGSQNTWGVGAHFNFRMPVM